MAEHTSLTAALAAAQGEYPVVLKGSVNPHFKSTYADLADGMGPIRPILSRHGIAYTQTFHVADGILLLRTSLRHGAEEIASDIPISQPAKPQDFVALTTYYRRVALFSIAGITPANEDDDGATANDVATTQEPPKRHRPAPTTPPDFIERELRPAKVEPNGNAVSNGRVKLSPSQEVDAALGEEADPLNLRLTKGSKAKFEALDLALRSAQTPGEVWSLWDIYQERAKAFGADQWALFDDYVATRIMDMQPPRNPLLAG